MRDARLTLPCRISWSRSRSRATTVAAAKEQRMVGFEGGDGGGMSLGLIILLPSKLPKIPLKHETITKSPYGSKLVIVTG